MTTAPARRAACPVRAAATAYAATRAGHLPAPVPPVPGQTGIRIPPTQLEIPMTLTSPTAAAATATRRWAAGPDRRTPPTAALLAYADGRIVLALGAVRHHLTREDAGILAVLLETGGYRAGSDGTDLGVELLWDGVTLRHFSRPARVVQMHLAGPEVVGLRDALTTVAAGGAR